MSIINVSNWSSEDVADWMSGLEAELSNYASDFILKGVNGAKLLNFMAGDLEHMGVSRVGDQILLHEAIQYLRQEMESEWTTVQTLASQLAVRSKTYRSQLTNLPKKNRIPTEYLHTATYLLDAGKRLLKWLRNPLMGSDEYDEICKKLTRYCFEIALLSQRDTFADNIIEEVQYLCTSIIEISDNIIKSRDSLIPEPASTHLLTLRKRKDQEFGFQLEQCMLSCQCLISHVDVNSAAFVGHLKKGDEILQINHRTIVGWGVPRIRTSLHEKGSISVVLTVKRRPRHGELLYDIYLRPARTPKRKHIPHVIEERTETEAVISENEMPTTANPEKENGGNKIIADFDKDKRSRTLRRRATISGSRPPTNSESFYKKGEDSRFKKRPPLDKSRSECEWAGFENEISPLNFETKAPEAESLPKESVAVTTNMSVDNRQAVVKGETVKGNMGSIAQNANDLPLIMNGYLHLRSMWKFGNRWKPLKAFLNPNFLIVGSITLTLREMQFGPAIEVNSRPFCFKLSAKNGAPSQQQCYYLAAESQQEYERWSAAIAQIADPMDATNGNVNAKAYRRSASLSASPSPVLSSNERPRRISLPHGCHVRDFKVRSNSTTHLDSTIPRTLPVSDSFTVNNLPKSNISSITIRSSVKNEPFHKCPTLKRVIGGNEPQWSLLRSQQQAKLHLTESVGELSRKPRMGISMISSKPTSRPTAKVCHLCGSQIGVFKVSSATQTDLLFRNTAK